MSKRRSPPSADKVETLVVTRSEKGALATQRGERADVPAEPVDKVVDTTGAGDLFAAGFLAGQARGLSLEQSLKLGAIAAAEVISALWRAARGGPQGAGRRTHRIRKRAAPKDRPQVFPAEAYGRIFGLPLSSSGASSGKYGVSSSAMTRWPLASSELCMP